MNKAIQSSLLLFLVVVNVHAQLNLFASKIDRGYKYLDKQNYSKAKETFEDILKEEPKSVGASYGLSKIYYLDKSGFTDKKKSYDYILKAEMLYETADAAKKEMLNGFKVNAKTIQELKESLEKNFYQQAARTNTLKGYDTFLKTYSKSKYVNNIRELKSRRAFDLAKKSNTITAYSQFVETYPKAKEMKEAMAMRNSMMFDSVKRVGTLDALDNFIKTYPDANEVSEAMLLRNQKAYIDLLESRAELQNSRIVQKQMQIDQQEMQKNGLIIGLTLVCLMTFGASYAFYNSRKANVKIKAQKDTIEKKNTQILDSIRYAKYIQDAILPSSKLVKEYLAESFILYKPKDIVSGDFYWMEQKDEKVLFAAVDCTGHGVPGAFMSIVGYNGLNRAVNEYNLTKPADILNSLNQIVNATLQKNMDESTVKDGMDIALCMLDTKTKVLEYSGAYNPLYLIQNDELKEIKANKQPIGAFLGAELRKFTNHELQLKKGDVFYIFSDGYADQFGGPNRKKYKNHNFRKLLLSIHALPMQEQRKILNENIENWKGNLEQTDDICVIGVKV